MNKKFFTLLFIASLPLVGLWLFMDLPDEAAIELLANGSYWMIAILLVFIGIAVLRMFTYVNQLQELILKQQAQEQGLEEEEVIKPASWWSEFYLRMTDAVPVEDEESIATDHNYDGIIELDNNLPPWWKAGFYLGIVFAAVYLLRYHVFQVNPLSHEEYALEMVEAEQTVNAYLATAKDLVDESTVVALMDGATLERGAKLFATNCVSCHRADGGGQIGPNLTDEFWIHGGGIADVFTTIKYGVTGKMVAWEEVLRASEMQDVASYVMSLAGTNPDNPRAPEGDLWVPEQSAE